MALRIAAIGDIHIGLTRGERDFAALFTDIAQNADVLLLCGDLTQRGTVEEAERVAEHVIGSSIPVIGVLGNHDHEAGVVPQVEKVLSESGMRLLGLDVHEIDGVGFAGVKGFGGGFGRHMLGSFGEAAIKNFVSEGVNEALLLENALHELRHLNRVVVAMHYSPIVATVVGEPVEIYPYLGSSRFEETIDRFPNIKAVFHGHAHQGTFQGKTGAGISVYNCAADIVKDTEKPYVVVTL